MQPYCTASIFSVRLSIPPSSPPSFHSFAPPRLLVLARRVHQHRIVLALALGRLVLGLFVQLLHELGLDLAAALLPPGLFGVGLGEDLVELGAEFVVLGDFVGGLEDGWAPVGGEGVGLQKLVRYRFEDVSFELARPKACEESNSQMLESRACEASSVRGVKTYLCYYITQLLLHLLLSSLKSLPQIIANTATLQQRTARLLGRLDLNEAVDVLDGAAEECSLEDALGDTGGLFAAVFGVHVEEGEVDVALEVRAEPGSQVGALGCKRQLL